MTIKFGIVNPTMGLELVDPNKHQVYLFVWNSRLGVWNKGNSQKLLDYDLKG